jgi:hypothetical protein
MIAENGETFSFPCTVMDCIKKNLKLVSKIAEACEKAILRDRVKYMPKANLANSKMLDNKCRLFLL